MPRNYYNALTESHERYLHQLFRLITTARRMKISRVVRALQDLIDTVVWRRLGRN